MYVVIVENKFIFFLLKTQTQIWYYVTDKMCITQPFDPCMGCLPLYRVRLYFSISVVLERKALRRQLIKLLHSNELKV